MTWEQIITILAVVGSALTVYFNLKKFGDNIRQEAEWRTTINNDMKNLLEKVTELLASHKDTVKLVQELMEFKTAHQIYDEAQNKEIEKMWKEIDKNRDDIKKLREIASLQQEIRNNKE